MKNEKNHKRKINFYAYSNTISQLMKATQLSIYIVLDECVYWLVALQCISITINLNLLENCIHDKQFIFDNNKNMEYPACECERTYSFIYLFFSLFKKKVHSIDGKRRAIENWFCMCVNCLIFLI
jgi:hypothetical protein